MSTHIKILSIIFMSSLIAACSSNLVNSEEEIEGKLTVLTVEFSSGAPVPELLISIEDASSGQEVDTVIGSIEGVAVFKGLQEDRTYKVTATSLENGGTGKSYPSIEEFTYKVSSPYYVLETHATNYQRLAIPKVLQKPELPNGCEITALTAVLNYYGLEMSKTEMTDNYLPLQAFRQQGNKKIGANPNVAYTGSPYANNIGTYVFAKPIAQAANTAIDENDLSLQVSNISGQTEENILNYTEQGVPVIVWVTLDLSIPQKKGGWIIEGTNEYHEMYQNLHSVVLIGQTEDKVIVMDPLKGYVEHNKQKFFKSYVELGKQAVAIHK